MRYYNMNNLKLDAEIISDFQGTINGHIITDGNLYDNLVIIIEVLLASLDEPNITKPDNFINDLIDAFEKFYTDDVCTNMDFYNNYPLTNAPDDFIELRHTFVIENGLHHTTFEKLAEIIDDAVDIEQHEEFKLLHERLTSGYYTS